MGLKKAAPEPKKIIAITVGINDYRHWTPLQGAVEDAEAVKKMLCEEFDAPRLEDFHLRNGKATVSQVKALFKERLPKVMQETGGDIGVFAFFACHGMVQNGQGFLIPAEAEAEPKAADCINIRRDIVEVCEARGFGARAVFLAFATCHSGIALKDTWSEEDEEAHPVQILAAGKTAQSIPDSHARRRNSLFTLALLEGLRGSAEAGLEGEAISGSELIGFVRARVYVQSRKFGIPLDAQGGYAQTNPSGDEFVFLPNRPRFSAEALNYLEGPPEFRKSKIGMILDEAKRKQITKQAIPLLREIIENDSDAEVQMEGVRGLGWLFRQDPEGCEAAVEALSEMAGKYLPLRKEILLELERQGRAEAYKELRLDDLIWQLELNPQGDEALTRLGREYADKGKALLKAVEELGNAMPYLYVNKKRQAEYLRFLLGALKHNEAKMHGILAQTLEAWLKRANESEEIYDPEMEKPPEEREVKARKAARTFWTSRRREKVMLGLIEAMQENSEIRTTHEAEFYTPPIFNMLMEGMEAAGEKRVWDAIKRGLSASAGNGRRKKLIEVLSGFKNQKSRNLLKGILQDGTFERELRIKALTEIGWAYFDFDHGLNETGGTAQILRAIEEAARSDGDGKFREACRIFLREVEARRTPVEFSLEDWGGGGNYEGSER